MDFNAGCLHPYHGPWGGCVLAVLITISLSEQWVNITFFCKLGKSAVETLVGLMRFMEIKILKDPVCEWHNQFKNDQRMTGR
jgi:hypothetical protein